MKTHWMVSIENGKCETREMEFDGRGFVPKEWKDGSKEIGEKEDTEYKRDEGLFPETDFSNKTDKELESVLGLPDFADWMGNVSTGLTVDEVSSRLNDVSSPPIGTMIDVLKNGLNKTK